MKNVGARGAAFVAAVVFACLPCARAHAQEAGRNTLANAAAIRAAPPAPVFDEEERRAELVERRARLAKEIGASGVLVLFSAEPRVYTGDVDYEYRQENNLYYLTHLKQHGLTLVLMPGNSSLPEILFLPRRSAFSETWYGPMYSPEEARRVSGVGEIWEAGEFKPFVEALGRGQTYRPKPDNVLLSAGHDASNTEWDDVLRPSAKTNTPAEKVAAAQNGFGAVFAARSENKAALYLLVPLHEADTGVFGSAREWRREQRFAEDWKKNANGFSVRSAFPLFWQMRMRKSPSEIRRLQHAVDISIEAHERAMAAAASAAWEYEVEAELLYTFTRRNASPGYPSIVGSGANATTMHYDLSQGRVASGDLILIDAGAEYDYYSADLTRTFPASGKFTPAQADIYQLVLDAQTAAIAAVRPGASLAEVNEAAVRVVKDGLLRLGLITDRDSRQYQYWFLHFTSHWLGMNVHDVGHGNARLEPGMVFTVEPGLYFRADALDQLSKTPDGARFAAAVRPAFEKYKGIGVRIEDDVVVTTDGARVLSSALPRTIPDLETFIERAQREYRSRF